MSEVIDLSKGQEINLAKVAPSTTKFRCALLWEAGKVNNYDVDLDASAFCLSHKSGSPKLLSKKHLVFYGNDSSPAGGVVHSGDDLTGASGEVITVDTSLLEVDEIDEVSFIVNIFEYQKRRHNMGLVSNASIAIYNDDNNVIIAEYKLNEDFNIETAVHFGSIYHDDGMWQFKAVGDGFTDTGLAEFITTYGFAYKNKE